MPASSTAGWPPTEPPEVSSKPVPHPSSNRVTSPSPPVRCRSSTPMPWPLGTGCCSTPARASASVGRPNPWIRGPGTFPERRAPRPPATSITGPSSTRPPCGSGSPRWVRSRTPSASTAGPASPPATTLWPWLWPESRRASILPAGRAGRPTPNARSKPAPELDAVRVRTQPPSGCGLSRRRGADSAAVGGPVAAVVVGRQRAGRLEVALEPLRHGLERIGVRIVGGHRGRGRGAAHRPRGGRADGHLGGGLRAQAHRRSVRSDLEADVLGRLAQIGLLLLTAADDRDRVGAGEGA